MQILPNLLGCGRLWQPLNRETVANVPQFPGVYHLSINGRVIYIGKASNLRERLNYHAITTDFCIRRANQFIYERCLNIDERERQLLAEFKVRHGRLPECNDRMG